MEAFGGSLVTLLLAGVLASCTSEDSEPTGARPDLLSTSDVGDVRAAEVFDSNGTGETGCAPPGGFESNFDASDPDTVGRSFQVAKGERVISTLLGKPSGRGSTAEAVKSVDDAIDECLSTSVSSFARLAGLPDGAVGFRSELETSNGGITTERAYARISDTRIVVVTVERTGGKPLTKSVTDLLPIAIERATSS